MNGALALSSLPLLITSEASAKDPVLRYAFFLWSAAHASQAMVGWLRILGSGRWVWGGILGPITYGDTTLAVANLVAALLL